ncbi:MAG: efflux RND transporter permease subunit [Marinifilaceae bacterium]
MDKLIKRRVLISMLFLGITLMGLFSYRHLSMELYPNAELPSINVTISARSELDPTYVKNKAVIPVEGVISSLEGVEEINTRISAGNARIQISFTQNTDTKFSFLQLEEKIKALKNTIPSEFNISVSKSGMNTVNSQFMSIQILGTGDLDVVRNIADQEIAPILENIDGIASLTLRGGRQKSIEILYNRDKCDALKITPSRISSLISKNMSQKSFAGSVYESNKRYFVNVEAEYLQTEDIGMIVVANGPILLKDIADIHFGVKEQENFSRVNGKEVISGVLTKSPLVNVIDLSERVQAEIERLNDELAPKGITIQVDNNVADIMTSNIDMIMNLGITGAILAIFILYLFLRNFKIVSFIAFAIPISIFSAFFVFYLFGISINLLTLTGIALAVGMLLDNSVVVMENIFRLRANGLNTEEASVRGTSEVRKSIIASTLTTIMVFLPFLFSSDYLLKLIGAHVGISIIATLLISLVVALLLIPMAINQFMKRSGNNVNFNRVDLHSKGVQFYIALLKMSLRRPTQVIVSALLLLVIALTLSFTLTLNTLKEVKVNTFNLYLTFPQGNTLLTTDEEIRLLEEKLLTVPEIDKFNSNVYAADASITIKLKEKYENIGKRDLASMKSIVVALAKEIQLSDVSLEALESSENFMGSAGGGNALMGGSSSLLKKMGMGSQQESIVLKGQDFDIMMNYADLLAYRIKELENISTCNVSATQRKPEAQLRFNQYDMGVNDVTLQNVSSELASFRPQTTTETKYKTDNEEYDITIKDKNLYDKQQEKKDYEEPQRTLDDLRALQVDNSNNAPIELRKFANINLRSGSATINRINQDNQITIRYRFQNDVNEAKQLLETARAEIDDVVHGNDIPSGIAVEIIHEEQETDEFTFLILATFALIFMILASVFESITAPIVLMFAIPLAAIGSLLALLVTDNALMNANVLIGFIILIGIVVNNSIILIDYTALLRREGYRKPRALMIAGLSRLRPILITAITTIIAMFPLAMGQGEFVSGLGAPFAITVIGGLVTSTLLTLLVIPTLYSGLEDALNRIQTQNLTLKVIQAVMFTASVFAIFMFENDLWWRIGYLAMATLLIPAITWFVENSLRRANSNIIPQDEEITISIRNLVKIYGRPSEFKREIESGNIRRRRLGMGNDDPINKLLWEVPLAMFCFYFSFMFIPKAFWALVMGAFTWYLVLDIYTLAVGFMSVGKKMQKVTYYIFNALRYITPMAILTWVSLHFNNSGLAILTGLLWYLILGAGYAAQQRDKHKHNEVESTNRFKKIYYALLQLTLKMPLIGVPAKPFRALNAVSLDIHTGMFGLLGPNGAGKTTLMRIICGIFRQSYGKIFINGIDTLKKREELQGIIGYLPQEFGTYENLTSWHFLEYQALLKGIYNKEVRERRIREVLEAVHMWERKDDKIGGFSGGMKQRIGIAQTLLNLPRILVVDEPTAGLDPRERIRFRNLLVELSKNRIVIFSTHIIEDIASSCNQVGVINRGEVKYHGTPAEMVNIAQDVTWTFEIDAMEFSRLPKDLLIVHHIRQGDTIRVRCLSAQKPTPNAVNVLPMLEDSYLWLLRGVKIANKEKIITQ